MHLALLASLLVIQASCEWVEITQEYKRPVKPTHNHPVIATTVPVSEVERTTNRNRIYINHSLHDYNWNSGFVHNLPDDVTAPFGSSFVNTNENRRPTINKSQESNKKGEIVIIRKPKPEDMKHNVNIKDIIDRRNTESGNVLRVRPMNREPDKRKPLEQYEDPVEVLNLSDLDYTTGADVIYSSKYNIANNINIKRKQHISSNTTPIGTIRNNADGRPLKSNASKDRRKPEPENESSTRPTLLKSTNMRRVEIIHSTEPTPTQRRKPLTSASSNLMYEENVTTKRQGTTPYKFPNIGHVKRVHLSSNNTIHPTVKPMLDSKYATTELLNEEEHVTEQSEENTNTKLRMHRPKSPSRVTTSERTIPVKIKAQKTRYENDNHSDKIISPEDIMVKEILNEEPENLDIKVHKVASIGNIKRVSNPVKTETNGHNEYDQNEEFAKVTPQLETDEEVIVENEDTNDQFNRVYKINSYSSSTEEIPARTTFKFKPKKHFQTSKPKLGSQLERYEQNPFRPVRPSHEPMPEFVTKEENFMADKNSNERYEITSDKNFIEKQTEPTYQQNGKENAEKNKGNDEYRKPKPQNQANQVVDEEETDSISSETKPGTMENLIKFLKTVTEIITKNSRRGLLGKMRYLEDLRDTILANIEERLEAAFPDDTRSSRQRRARSSTTARGHVEFPSSEHALMTISFLTFAVFLIKLVLQVIQAYKNKTMMVMPTVISAVGKTFSSNH